MNAASDGLLQARLLNGQGGDQAIGWDGIRSWTPNQGPLWVHLDFTQENTQRWLLDDSGLPTLIGEALVADETRPRCEAIGDGLLISLRGVNTNPGADPEDMVSIRLYCDGRRIITTRRRKLMSVLDIAATLDAGHGPRSAGELLTALAGQLVERMGGVIAEMEDRLDNMEERLLDNSSQGQRMELLELRRETIMLRRYLSPQREAMNRLLLESVAWLTGDDRMRLREINDKLTRYIEDLDALRDRGIVASEELSGRLSEQMNLRMYVLSLIAGVFLPLGFVTGLLGINVGGIPGAENPWGFAIVLGLLLVIAVLQLLLFRRKNWL